MSYTSITNLFVPEVWFNAAREASTKLDNVINSALVLRNQLLDGIAGAAGKTANLPHFKPIAVSDRVQTSASDVPVSNVETATQVAVLCNREFALGSEALAAAISGSDPVAFITGSIAKNQLENMQTTLVYTLRGVFASALSALVENISTETGNSATDANKIDAETFIDANFLLGDHAGKIGGMLAHSVVVKNLRKQDLIDYIPASEGSVLVPMYMGVRVYMDDTLSRAGTTNGTVYETYLYAAGAVGIGIAPLDPSDTSVSKISVYPLPLSNTVAVINRYRFIIHVMGTKWVGTASAAGGPTDAELATSGNWNKVYETKNIGIIQIRSNG